MAGLEPSPTLAIAAKARAMREAGKDIVSLAAGEPDFDTPEPVCAAAIAAIQRGFTRYTPTTGIRELKERIADKLFRENAFRVEPEQVVVTCGAKHALFNALMVLLDPGDEVVLISPYWMTYAEQIRLAGATPVSVHSRPDRGFVPDEADLKAAFGPRTKAIVLNSPCNPTGAVYPREFLKLVASLALRFGCWIVSDEIYEKMVYDGQHVSPASLGREIAERTITVNGCSKTFAMTGWRIGYAAAPLPIAQAIATFQDQVTSNATSFAQCGAVAALELSPEHVEAIRSEYRDRRDLMLRELSRIPGIGVMPPAGAFYVFADCSALIRLPGHSDHDLADFLLEQALVATIPGSVFGGPGFLRLTFAASRDDIRRGVARMAEALPRFSG